MLPGEHQVECLALEVLTAGADNTWFEVVLHIP